MEIKGGSNLSSVFPLATDSVLAELSIGRVRLKKYAQLILVRLLVRLYLKFWLCLSSG